MTLTLAAPLWRVGYHRAPLDFKPHELYDFVHRFDDAERRFRTLYFAEMPETALREVLADFRPNLAYRARYLATYGPEAAGDLPAAAVTAAWRRENVLASALLELHGDLVDLTDVATRYELEDRHADLLTKHGLSHLDLHEITTRRRIVTQTIAADLYDRGAAAIRFPSSLDQNPCVALLEGRATVTPASAPIPLIDPAPEPLLTTCAAWRLVVEPAVDTAASQPTE